MHCLDVQLLLDALLFGVLPIVYEYDATTMDALLFRLRLLLGGRQARSEESTVKCMHLIEILKIVPFISNKTL